jgi:hypothetical protein
VRSPTDRAPLRVLVKGAAPATGPGYPGVIERELLASGRNAVVRDVTAPAEGVTAGIRTWEAQVFPWSPDVVVLDYARHEARRRSSARFVDDLERLVQRIVYISNPLVLLPTAPNSVGRSDAVNAALAEVVARMDRDNVRVFEVGDGDHEAIGRAMAAEIGPWCDEHVPV